MTYTKAILTDVIENEVGFSKKESKKLVNDFFEIMMQALEAGQDVKISGFGNFHIRSKKERPGRNPKTGDIIPVTSRKVVTFKAGQKLKKRVAMQVRS